jgi:hypothetical protein
MEQLVILLIIAAISLINWILQKSAEFRKRKLEEARKQRDGDTVPADFTSIQEEETENWEAPPEELRKFLEALGVPEEELAPKPKPAPPPPVPVATLPPPPALPRRSRFQKPDEEMLRMARRLESAEQGMKGQEQPAFAGGQLNVFLKDPNSARNAIVLRELLGPPKGWDFSPPGEGGLR